MQFNDHQEKYKQEDIRGIHGEQFRELPSYKNYVDPSRTSLNRVHIFNPELNSENWNKRIKECKKIHEQTTGKSLRKDAVVFISDIATVPKEWPVETVLQYFEERNIFMEHFLLEHGVKKEYLLSSVIHMDETEPHQTIVYMPFKDGKFQAKNITNKIMLKQLQSQGWEFYKDFESRHPEIGAYKLEPYEVGGSDHKKKKKHLEELEYKIQQEEKKLEVLQESIKDKESELEVIETQIIDNPVKRLSNDSSVVNGINKIIHELNTSKDDFKDSHDDPVLKSNVPAFDKSDWLEKDVKIVEAKKDLFGNEKSPAHVEIDMEEWNRKINTKAGNERAFNKLFELYNDIREKYFKVLLDMRQAIPEVERKVVQLTKYFKNIVELPAVTTWRSIKTYEQRIGDLQSMVYEKDRTISSLLDKASESKWFKDFYNKALLILKNSFTREGVNSLDEILKPYSYSERDSIIKDIESLEPKQFKRIVYQKGDRGYGWYASREEGGKYLGDDMLKLKRMYPDASFEKLNNRTITSGIER